MQSLGWITGSESVLFVATMTDSLIRKLTRLFCCLAHADKRAHSVRLPIQLHFATHHYHLHWLAYNTLLHYQRECSCNDTGVETAKCWPAVQDTLHQVYFHLAFGNTEVTDSLISYSVLQASFESHKMQVDYSNLCLNHWLHADFGFRPCEPYFDTAQIVHIIQFEHLLWFGRPASIQRGS